MELDQASESLRRYAQDGVPTGGFLRAVLENDLMEALWKADSTSLFHLRGICMFIYNDLPAGCHGSVGKSRGMAQDARRAAEAGAAIAGGA